MLLWLRSCGRQPIHSPPKPLDLAVLHHAEQQHVGGAPARQPGARLDVPDRQRRAGVAERGDDAAAFLRL